MKKITLLCGLFLAVTASVAAAGQGVGLRWNSCIGDAGASNKTSACVSNTGNNILVGTFEVNADLLQTSGTELVVDLASADPVLPAWWQFKNAGTCRATSLSMNAVISGLAVNCADWAAGAAAGGIGAYITSPDARARATNTARLVAALAVPVSGLADLTPATEYFSFNLIINNAKSSGVGLCAGCSNAVCIVFNSVLLTTPVAANNVLVQGPSNGTDSHFCTWQGGAGVSVGAAIGCPAATPTKNATWGQVKTLYR